MTYWDRLYIEADSVIGHHRGINHSSLGVVKNRRVYNMNDTSTYRFVNWQSINYNDSIIVPGKTISQFPS